MITTANYLVESRKIDFSQLPAPIRDTHDVLLAGSDNGADWQSFTADPDIKEIVDLYLEKLNQAVKPRRKANPAKLATARRARGTLTKTDRRSATRRTVATKTGATRRAARPQPASEVIILMSASDTPSKPAAAAPRSKASKVLQPRTKKEKAQAKVGTVNGHGRLVTGTYYDADDHRHVSKVAKKKPATTGTEIKQATGAAAAAEPKTARSAKQSLAKPKITKAQKKEALREGVETAQQAAIRKMTPAQVIAIGKRINEKRFKMEIDGVMYDVREDFDTPATNKQRLAPTGENLVKWAEKPGRYDLIGVDAAGKVDVTVFKKRDKGKVPLTLTRKPKLKAMRVAANQKRRSPKSN